ncbi:MAG: ribonuclease HII [Methanomassiliicoccus sp.]|nr:ribonuclease HII [Methanomassiliicoccus sp.]
MICGVDEAGRGPVMGPLVVAAVMVENDRALRKLKVKDSKLLSHPKREELDLKIREIAMVEVSVVTAAEIDEFMKGDTLNVLEVERFAALIERLHPERAFVDAADVVEERFGRNIMDRITCRPELVCSHHADVKFPVVSAASIVAKVLRDRTMDTIQEAIGRPIGSGYAHDEVTLAFIRGWLKENGSFPPHVRTSWKTAKDLYSLSKVTKLTDWTDG